MSRPLRIAIYTTYPIPKTVGLVSHDNLWWQPITRSTKAAPGIWRTTLRSIGPVRSRNHDGQGST